MLEKLGYDNVTVIAGDGSLGLPEQAPFDGILVAAAAPQAPPPLLEQLADGGRLVVPLGPPAASRCSPSFTAKGRGLRRDDERLLPLRAPDRRERSCRRTG